jgi:hypothetical protein
MCHVLVDFIVSHILETVEGEAYCSDLADICCFLAFIIEVILVINDCLIFWSQLSFKGKLEAFRSMALHSVKVYYAFFVVGFGRRSLSLEHGLIFSTRSTVLNLNTLKSRRN